MKTFVILFTLFYFLNALAVAPYGIQGQQQSQTLYSNVHKFPNNQVTNLGGINALVETGNKNILSNPDFEHQTFSTSWTNSAGTFTQELTNVISGKASAKLVLSSQTMSLIQSSTLYAGSFADGVQGLASVRVKSDVALKVCSIQAGTVSTTNCVDVVANNKWGLYKVPFILGATSNGISIASTGAVSGTVYIDDAFVGAVDLKADIDSSKLAGESYFAAGGSFASTSYVSASGSRSPTIVLQNEGDWQTSALTGYKQAITNLPAGCYTYTWTFGAAGSNIGAIQQFAGAINGTVQTGSQTYFTQGSGMGSGLSVVGSHCITNIQDVTYELQGKSNAGSVTPGFGVINFNLQKFSSGSTYSSTNADTDWASCGHTAASFTGFGTVTAIETQCKRQGSDLLMKGKFTAGIPTSVEARVSLPLWNGVQLTSAGSSIIPSLQVAGPLTSSFFSSTYYSYMALIEPSVTYMTSGIQINTTSSINKTTGAGLVTTGNSVSFNVRIPIEGWQQSNIIIGQFNGLESCTDSYECTDTFSAKVSSAGVVSDENIEWITGSVTPAASVYTVTFKTGLFTVPPTCVFSSTQNNNLIHMVGVSTTASNTVVKGSRSDQNLAIDSAFNIVCQKQGVDYIGKTAKAVASDQNVRTPGVTKAVFYSAGLTSAGVPIIEIGDFLNGSCTCSSGSFSCSFNSGVWASAPSCQITNPSTRDRTILYPTESTASLSFTVQNTAGTGICEAVKISCHGVSP